LDRLIKTKTEKNYMSLFVAFIWHSADSNIGKVVKSPIFINTVGIEDNGYFFIDVEAPHFGKPNCNRT
jgi:hypothetical protein